MWSARQTWKMGRRAAGFLGGLLATTLLVAAPAAAAFDLEHVVNVSKSAAPSQRPAIAVNKAGQVFVAWQEGGEIVLRRSEPPKASCGGPGAPTVDYNVDPVNLSGLSGGATAPAVAATESGHVFVAWQVSSGGSSAIWFSRSDDGQNFSKAVNLSGAVGAGSAPSVAASAGDVFVAWSGASLPAEIFLARSIDFGANWVNYGAFGAPANLSNTTFTNSRAPSVATDGINVFVAWEEGSSFLGNPIQLRKFGRPDDPTGAGSLLVNFSSLTGQAGLNPHLAFVDGVLSVAFANLKFTTAGLVSTVYHSFSNNGGTIFDTPQALSGAGMVRTNARVARRNGSALVAWSEALGANGEIWYRLLGNGAMPGSDTVSPTTGTSVNPAVTIDFNDRLLVAWQETVNPNTVNEDLEIYLAYSAGTGGGTMMEAKVWAKEKVLDLRHLAKGHRGDSERESDGEHHRGGRFTAFIELPGGLAGDIDLATVQPALLAPGKPDDDDDDDEKGELDDDWAKLGDKNKNGIPDLKVKFSRSAFSAAGQTDAQGNVSYTVTGRTKSGGCFSGLLKVRVRQ